MRERILKKYAAWVVRHPLAIVITAVLLSVFSVSYASFFLKPKTGILDLYAKDEPVARRFINYVQKFGAAETLVLVFEGPDQDLRRQAIDQLARRLREDSNQQIADIFYQIDLGLYKKHAFQFLSQAEAEKLLEDIENPHGGIRQFFLARDINDYLNFLNESIESGLKKPSSLNPEKIAQFGQGLRPLHLFNEFLSNPELTGEAMTTLLQQKDQDQSTVDELGYLRTDDEKMHLMMIRPIDIKQDYEIAKKLLQFVRQKVQEIRKEFPQVTIGLTGGPALNNDQFETSEKDMTLASIFALVSTAIIFFLAFKSFGRPILGLLTLAISLSWSFGLTTFYPGHLNMFSLAFVVILVGQGTYYGVHVVARYEEELIKGRSVPIAIQETIVHIFGNITTSTVTTASAFFATTLVKLQGFAELGWIAGMGILLSSLGMQVLLPAFLLLYDRHGPRRIRKKKVGSFGARLTQEFTRIAKLCIQKGAYLLIFFTLSISGWGAYTFFSEEEIAFDSNVLNLQAKNTEAVKYEKKLIETSLSPRAGIFLTKELAKAHEMVEKLQKLPTIQRVEWIGEVFPEGVFQGKAHQELREALKKISPAKLRSPDLRVLEENFIRLNHNLEQISELALNYTHGEKLLEQTEAAISDINQIQEKIPTFSKNLDEKQKEKLSRAYILPIIQAFQNKFFPAIRNMLVEAAKAEKLQLAEIPPEILDRFLSKDQTYAIYAFPSVNIWEREPLEQFVQDLRSVSTEVTGPPVMFQEILNLVRNNYFQAAFFAAIAIFLVFLINFRSIRYTILAFLPLIMGCLSLVGLMQFFNLSFNIANLIALPMILGIGADNGVHMIERFREEKETNIDFLFHSTGKALLITYLDTLTSFVGLAVANHQGLAQLGRIVILGITCCTVMGMIFLPSVMSLIAKRRSSH